MQMTNTVAAAYGLLVMHAMDMFRVNTATLTPVAPDGLTQAGWEIAAYITGQDTILRKGPLKMAPHTVCYGYVAKNAIGEMVVAIRGTDQFVEWVEDAEFTPIAYLRAALPGQAPMVEEGFWGVYASMRLIDKSGGDLGELAPAIGALADADVVGGAAGPVIVIGHSLGSALATYLTLDLARGALGGRVSGCLFASPHTGNQAFVDLFDGSVADYRLFNYILDIVPRVPIGLGYQPLPRRTVLQPGHVEAVIKVDIGCNHHVICYCAMLDYEETIRLTTPPPAGEEGSATCILGPETGRPSVAKELLSVLAGAVPV